MNKRKYISVLKSFLIPVAYCKINQRFWLELFLIRPLNETASGHCGYVHINPDFFFFKAKTHLFPYGLTFHPHRDGVFIQR